MVKVFKLSGKLVYQYDGSGLQEYDNEFIMEVSGWTPGLYMVVCSSSGIQQAVKLMVTSGGR